MYQVTFTGLTPLLMHSDNIEWADQMEDWKTLNARKKSRGETADASKAGDDRTPAWRWIGCLWNDESRVVIPQDALRRCLIDAAQNQHRYAARRIRKGAEIVKATDRTRLDSPQQKTHDMVAVQTADLLRRSRMLTRTATVELHGTPTLPAADEA